MPDRRKAWCRWLSARGVPPGHIARVLGCDPADVAGALRERHGHTRYDIDPARVAELRASGATWRAIGEALGCSPQLALFYHRRRGPGWRPKAPVRPPEVGATARLVRGLADLGYGRRRIAALTGLGPARVASLLGLPGPRPPGPREWGWSRGPEYREDGPAVESPRVAGDVAEAIRIGPPPIPPPSGDWGPIAGGKVGARSNNAALTDADAELARRLRAEGVPRADVAARLGVSVATITRITRGETYRPVAEVEPDQVVAIEPQIAVAEGPGPAAWTEPGRPGRRPPREYRDD